MADVNVRFTKDGDAVLDYSLNWASWLAAVDPDDTIATSTWSRTGPDSALTIGIDTESTTSTTVWLSGGTVGKSYRVTNRIITAGGRTDERSFTVDVRDR